MQKASLIARICDPRITGAVTRDKFAEVLHTMEFISTTGMKEFALFNEMD